jgi:hypothetical protein
MAMAMAMAMASRCAGSARCTSCSAPSTASGSTAPRGATMIEALSSARCGETAVGGELPERVLPAGDWIGSQAAPVSVVDAGRLTGRVR